MGRDDWGKITGALTNFAEAPLWIDDSASSTVMEIGAKARRLKRDRGLSLLVVDYLQLVVPTHTGRGTNRQEEVSSISRGLKGLAKELKVPISCSASLPAHLNVTSASRSYPTFANPAQSSRTRMWSSLSIARIFTKRICPKKIAPKPS